MDEEPKSNNVSLEQEELINVRKEKVASFLKKKKDWIIYLLLAIIVFIAVKIRIRNIDKLRDITTGTWTLGPDLDPFLFLRWAKYIIENGSLMVVDVMRYVPLGYSTKRELILHPYMISWFHNIASIFGSESVTQSAVFYPVFFFAITVVAFFLFVRKIFVQKLGKNKANSIALLSSLFLSIIPPILPRTIAGIPEKESAAFFFLFISFYFFLSAWKSKKKYGKYLLAVFAGLSTAGMALVWGGFAFIFLTLGIALLISFFIGQIDKEKFYISLIWIVVSFGFMIPFTERYTFGNLLASSSTGGPIFVLLLVGVYFVLYKTKMKKYFEGEKISKIPKPVVSLIISAILGILFISLWLGPSFIIDRASGLYSDLIKPAQSRLIQTVAENRQPYFGEWSNSFGPLIKGIPIFFWLFVIGSVYLFFNMLKMMRKQEKIFLTIGYVILLSGIIFSRFSSNHFLNGENFTSVSFYFLGIILFLVTAGYYYNKYYKEGEIYKLAKIDFAFILLFAFFVLSIISARGAVRLIMVLAIPAVILVSYLSISLAVKSIANFKESNKNIFLIGFTIIVLLAVVFSGFNHYESSNNTASNFAPSVYTQQWQKAMAWTRDNTSEDAVFGHWWDYGYWLQSLGERATVLDGGNAISYWNHLMGRYALTGSNNKEALEFLYSHETTHFLIDSSDIGKYTAFSSIGSDPNYDRRSWINTFLRDDSQIFEAKNSTILFYTGGASLDEDIEYVQNGETIFLPGVEDSSIFQSANLAGIGAVRIEIDKSQGVLQPIGLFVYQGRQYELPLRYAFFDGNLIDFNNGVEAGVFLMPRVIQNADGVQVDRDGALLYLSSRTVKSQLARLYLYGEENQNFKLVHTEPDFIIDQLRSQGLEIGEFAHFQGFRGPIRIWEIDYPSDIEFKEEFLNREYPIELYLAT